MKMTKNCALLWALAIPIFLPVQTVHADKCLNGRQVAGRLKNTMLFRDNAVSDLEDSVAKVVGFNTSYIKYEACFLENGEIDTRCGRPNRNGKRLVSPMNATIPEGLEVFPYEHDTQGRVAPQTRTRRYMEIPGIQQSWDLDKSSQAMWLP
ncbi:MAG: hypothetical protein PUH24_07450 [Prevotellaceae bacterium]|nr:hypothetical protein [Prevotella sp.]MDD7258082.1 hypothetical protein [Prevotellaceae bacterium]MDY6131650.1 hypothetical protein [Prevotella sp.]